MKAMKGYYSVIQYCPDASRLESANIGVLLLCPETRFVRAKTSAGSDRIARFFGRESFDPQRLLEAKRSIERRVEVDCGSFCAPEDLVRFMDTRGNEIVLTPPRPMRVMDPEQDLDNLFNELVGGRARRERKQPAIPALDAVFQRPSLQGRIHTNLSVTVPTISRALRIPYAYRNGVLNLVKPQRFGGQEDRATSMALRLAIEGDLLRKHPEHNEERKLIVVPAFEGALNNLDLRHRVDAVLQEYHVRVVHADAIEAFANEVEAEAH